MTTNRFMRGGVACARILRHADEQRLRRFPDAPVALPHLFLRLGTRQLRTGDGHRRLAATRLEPVAQRCRRETVLAVVRGHPVAKGGVDAVRIAHLERQLDVQARQRGVAEVVLAPEADERLELLEPVPLDADAKPFADDGVQIDEAAAAEQAVERLGASPVSRDEALQCRRLVDAEVVHVQIRVRLQPRQHEVQERLAHRALVRGRECPAVLVRPGPVDLAERPAGQVLEAAVAEERIALEIEEHVAPRRLGQPREAALGLGG